MTTYASRREFLRNLGVGAAAVPFVLNLPSLGFASGSATARRQRLVVMFSPNGVIPKNFWPDKYGKDFELKESLTPLEPFGAEGSQQTNGETRHLEARKTND